MIKYAGKVITHRQLLKEVWGPDSVFETHYLRVYMAQLRRKIEADPAQPRFLLDRAGGGLPAGLTVTSRRVGCNMTARRLLNVVSVAAASLAVVLGAAGRSDGQQDGLQGLGFSVAPRRGRQGPHQPLRRRRRRLQVRLRLRSLGQHGRVGAKCACGP